MSSLLYFLREAVVGFKRNFSTAIGSVITIFLSLFIIGLFLVGTIIINNIVVSVEKEVSITVYIADDANQDSVQKLSDQIKENSLVNEVRFTNKDQALEKFRDSMSASPEIIEQLDGQNPLPASIDVELKNPQDVEGVAKQIESNETLKEVCDNKTNPAESVKYGQKTVQNLFALTNAIRFVGIALVALLIVIALIFINNTIRLSILARRKEIAIMRLVGASNGFIRGPFFTESCLHSLIGAVVSIIILELFRNIALPNLIKSLPWLPLNLDIVQFIIIYVVLIVAGVIIGIIGSALAMRRYLKV